jgi:RNA polymerase primary sigma factor
MSDDFFLDRVFTAYYDDVGKHEILSPEKERALLLRYRTCFHCEQPIPQKVPATNCPYCGTIAPSNTSAKGRQHICSSCANKFDIHMTPKRCPACGADRDVKAREQLIVSNLRFVMKTAKSFSRKPSHIQRLVSAGNVGLILAVDKFELSRETRFLTYAAWWIRKEMLDEINSLGLIHIPSHKQKSIRKEMKEGTYVCRHCEIRTHTPDHIAHLPPCIEKTHDFILPNTPGPFHSITTLENLSLADEQDVEFDAVDENSAQILRDAIRSMNVSERDKFIVIQYYNVPQEERKSAQPKSLHQLAAVARITPERVRQIKEKLLKDLRVEMKRRAVCAAQDICW